jgi:hypothetical protein
MLQIAQPRIPKLRYNVAAMPKAHAITDPECKPRNEENGGCGCNHFHLAGIEIDTQGKCCGQEQHILLKCVVENAPVHQGRSVFLMQCWINRLTEKAVVADGDDADEQRQCRKRARLERIGKPADDVRLSSVSRGRPRFDHVSRMAASEPSPEGTRAPIAIEWRRCAMIKVCVLACDKRVSARR